MDITKLFKATIKTVRLRRKGLVEKSSEDVSVLQSKEHRKKTGFQTGSTEVSQSISKLKDFLAEHRKDYIGEFSSVFGDIDGMTDEERDQVDKDAQLFMRTCSASINLLKNQVKREANSCQLTVHRKAVVILLENYLKGVCKLYSQQKAIRVRKAVDRKKMSRLNPHHTDSEHRTCEDVVNQIREEKARRPIKQIVTETVPPVDSSEPTEVSKLSKDEIQLFEKENEALLNELNNIVDEVKQIEGKVVEISQLQEIFSEKILDQANVIEKTHETAVTTTENIKDGNENIREAIKNSASFRVWILFFLVMCTFSLLFLDWYSQ